MAEDIATSSGESAYTEEEVTGFGVDYDYDSAMHYSRTGFSINGEDTITPLVRYEWNSE